jgi:hypothetical protein
MSMKKKKTVVKTDKANQARTSVVKINEPSSSKNPKEHGRVQGFLGIGKNSGGLLTSTKTYLASIFG